MQYPVSLPQSVVIVTHELYEGSAHALRDFLNIKKIPRLLFISHPFSNDRPWSYYELYAYGRRVHHVQKKRYNVGTPLSYCIDFYLTCVWLRANILPNNTYYIGVNPLNTVPGVIFRFLHSISKVTYYSIDFTPVRFTSRILNWIYHTLEVYCITNANFLWNVSPRIADGRKKYLRIDPNIYKQTVVPIGIWKNDIQKGRARSVGATIIFVGHILKKQGIQKVIEALPFVVRRFPQVCFTVIGSGEYERSIRLLVIQLKLSRVVTFYGWIADRKKIQRKIRESDLAVATYEPYGQDTTNFSYYADSTKIKTYLANGVPVITTDVPYNARVLERSGCVFVVKYDAQSIAYLINKLLSHRNILLRAKNSARKAAGIFTWEQIFEQAFASVV